MSRAWWGREALDEPPTRSFNPPVLSKSGRNDVAAEVGGHIAAFTPEWRQRHTGDPGDALLYLHAELAEPILKQLNRLPEKLFREYLITAGVDPIPARPARAMLSFTASDSSPGSVLVPRGFQVTAPPADGSDTRVVFETEQDLHAAPGEIGMTVVQDGEHFYEVDTPGLDGGDGIDAFGANPQPGSAFLIGLTSAHAPGPSVSFSMHLSRGSGPPPAAVSGARSLPANRPRAVLRWSFFDGTRFEQAEVVRDETRGLQQSGIVELRTPRRWRGGTPAGVSANRDLRWMRVQFVNGEFATPPTVGAVFPEHGHRNRRHDGAGRSARIRAGHRPAQAAGQSDARLFGFAAPDRQRRHDRRGRRRRSREQRAGAMDRGRRSRCIRSRRAGV